jgi:hypothetical protein
VENYNLASGSTFEDDLLTSTGEADYFGLSAVLSRYYLLLTLPLSANRKRIQVLQLMEEVKVMKR